MTHITHHTTRAQDNSIKIKFMNSLNTYPGMAILPPIHIFTPAWSESIRFQSVSVPVHIAAFPELTRIMSSLDMMLPLCHVNPPYGNIQNPDFTKNLIHFSSRQVVFEFLPLKILSSKTYSKSQIKTHIWKFNFFSNHSISVHAQ